MRKALAFLVLVPLFAGCASVSVDPRAGDRIDNTTRSEANHWMVAAPREAAIVNAVVRQAALFPYHFVKDSGALNPVGERDLAILANHYRDYPGPLTVRRGPEAEPLYQARINTVTAFLADRGVAVDAVPVGDGTVGGDGIEAVRVIEIMTDTGEVSETSVSMAPTLGIGGN